MPTIRTKTTITITADIPYNDDFYPGQSLGEALRYEEQLPRQEILENFVQNLEFSTDDDKIDVSREISLIQEDGTEVGHHRLEALKSSKEG